MGTVQIGYTVDSVGNPLAMSDWVGTSSYAYDANNRLASAVIPSPVPGQPAIRALGKAHELLAGRSVQISVSHSGDYAVAVVLIENS